MAHSRPNPRDVPVMNQIFEVMRGPAYLLDEAAAWGGPRNELNVHYVSWPSPGRQSAPVAPRRPRVFRQGDGWEQGAVLTRCRGRPDADRFSGASRSEALGARGAGAVRRPGPLTVL
ncbi:hypothetical protein Pmi06nite_83840 [Planotetraspora mira]|uniref:Uncharacterized protein n=1 Tax=Planotetraspora mira TaxID=58121 RepID=A0A8J3XBD6_9ACTN|nr:hypothetical protein Pmi06nite_83840 [Planotetraspora mira]